MRIVERLRTGLMLTEREEAEAAELIEELVGLVHEKLAEGRCGIEWGERAEAALTKARSA